MTRYTVEYTIRDLSIPRLERTELLRGRNRVGAEQTVTFATFAAAENAASVQRAQTGVLRAYVLDVVVR